MLPISQQKVSLFHYLSLSILTPFLASSVRSWRQMGGERMTLSPSLSLTGRSSLFSSLSVEKRSLLS